MKVIDLLNKIANGEEIHFDTKLNDKSVRVNYYNDRDFSSSTDPEMLTIADIIKSLNDEVETLEEEKKIPEKLEDRARFQYSEIPTWLEKKEIIKAINENFEKHQKAIYEIIDFLKQN